MLENVLIYINNELNEIGYPVLSWYPNIAPQESQYPFITYTCYKNSPITTQGDLIEDIYIRFETHGIKTSILDIIEIDNEIEHKFNNTPVPITLLSPSIQLVCVHKVQNFITPLYKEKYCKVTSEYIFKVCENF